MVARDFMFSEAAQVKLGDEASKAEAAQLVLLVVAVPPTDTEAVGQRLGALLNHGSDAQLAPLGRCHLVCAPVQAVRQRWPALPEGVGLVWRELDAAGVERLAWARLPMPDRAKARASSLSSDAYQDQEIRLGLNELAGALVQLEGGAPFGRDVSPLAARARAEFKDKAPAGGRWAWSSGCGNRYEDGDNAPLGKCGMGYMPELSRRFLSFMAKGADR